MRLARSSFSPLQYKLPETYCMIGDSIMSFHDVLSNSTANGPWSQGYLNWAMNKMGWPLTWLNNGASGGLSSAQILATWNTQVLPYNPGYLFYNGGINDLGAGLTSEQTLANLQTIARASVQAGIFPIYFGIHATSSLISTAARLHVTTVNTGMQQYFERNPGMFIDMFTPTLNYSTGNEVTNYTYDGMHLSSFGARIVGVGAGYNALSLLFTSQKPTVNANDGLNIFPNGTLSGSNATGAGGYTRSASWTAAGNGPDMFTADGLNINAATSVITSPASRVDVRPGNLWVLTPVMTAINGFGRAYHVMRWDTARANSQAYTVGQWIIPATPNGYMYVCTTAGTSHSSPPTFGTVVGGTTAEASGTVVWKCYNIPLAGEKWEGTFELSSLVVTSGSGMPTCIVQCLDNTGATLYTAYTNFWDSSNGSEVYPTALTATGVYKTRPITIPTGTARVFIQAKIQGANLAQLGMGINLMSFKKINA